MEYSIGEIVLFKNDFGDTIDAEIVDKIYFNDGCIYYQIKTEYGVPRKMFKNGKGLSKKN